jgi:hypothetical protein
MKLVVELVLLAILYGLFHVGIQLVASRVRTAIRTFARRMQTVDQAVSFHQSPPLENPWANFR